MMSAEPQVVTSDPKIDGMEKLMTDNNNNNNNIESFLPKESSSFKASASSLKASEITVDNNQDVILDTLSNLALFVVKSTILLVSVFFIANKVDYVRVEKQSTAIIIALTTLAVTYIQHYYFTLLKASSPRVPLKQLPPRPALQILFKPDDGNLPVDDGALRSSAAGGGGGPAESLAMNNNDDISVLSEDVSWREMNRSSVLRNRMYDAHSVSGGASTSAYSRSQYTKQRPVRKETKASSSSSTTANNTHYGLPDSFAPLLSSSEMQLLTHNLTADLLHACYVHATVQLREGRHIIPLNKNELRPQFYLDSTNATNNNANNSNTVNQNRGGCQISASVVIGSQHLSRDQDLDTATPTMERSRPIVKNMELVFDPPLRLGNVAPTLLHFPTLFEDLTWMPVVRGSYVLGYLLDFMSSLWYLVEKILWYVEKRCVIHLGKVKAMPIYRGSSVGEEDANWRLGLAFSGYVLLFDRIPIPFLSVRLPTFIIPQPHALLEKLVSAQPLASARLKRENIAEEKIVIAALNALESWTTNVKVVGTPPALGVDLTMPGGITVAVEMMHGRENINQQNNKRQAGGGVSSSIPREISSETVSTWQTPYPTSNDGGLRLRNSFTGRSSPNPPHQFDSVRSRATAGVGSVSQIPAKMFDANSVVPWYFEAAVNGSIDKDKLVVSVPICKARHIDNESIIPSKSMFTLTGSVVVCRAQSAATVMDRRPAPPRPAHIRSSSNSHLIALNAQADVPPIHALMLYPDTYVPTTKRTNKHLLEYDYEFDVGEESHLDAISLTYGASHPMLNGGTLISCMLESIYAYGSIFAREGAIADPTEKLRKRNILRHLPAVEFTAGIQNFYLPKQAVSYIDDGNTVSIPEVDGGRVMFRITGGIDEKIIGETLPTDGGDAIVREGIKLIAEFG
eukprot:scaffold7169_cov76-Cyclotella_meneghiniana.AAC.1